MSPVLFSTLACAIIFLFTVKQKHLLSLLGWILTPFLLISLIAIIILGLITAPAAPSLASSPLAMFLHGLSEGYNTMDLLAAFFFSSTIINVLRLRSKADHENKSKKNYLEIALRASLVGAALLAAIYVGFSYIGFFSWRKFSN